MSLLRRVGRFLIRPRGNRRWDAFLRATAALALLAIPVLLVFPQSTTLVWLAVLSLPANSPLSPILPTVFEPLIMEAAKYERVVPVTLVATGAYMYMEYVNWHVYRWVLNWERLGELKRGGVVRWAVTQFDRWPFALVVVFAFTPLPFFVVRGLAILHGYPTARFLWATLVGRLPRFLAYAWIGEVLRVPTLLLVAIVVVPTAVVVGRRWARGEALLAESVSPAAAELSESMAAGGTPVEPLAGES